MKRKTPYFSVFIQELKKKPSFFCCFRHSQKLYLSTTNSIDAFCVKLLMKSIRVSYFLSMFQNISIVLFQKNQLCLFVCFIIFILCNLVDEKFFSTILSLVLVSWTFLACRNFRNFKLLKVFELSKSICGQSLWLESFTFCQHVFLV